MDAGTGFTAIRPLQEGVFLVRAYTEARASTAGLTAAQKLTLQRTGILCEVEELFGGGSYDRRILDGDNFCLVPASGPAQLTTGPNFDMIYRASGHAIIDVPAFGDNLGDQYGWVVALTANTDPVTGSTFPVDIAGGVRLFVYRLSGSLPTASLPWW